METKNPRMGLPCGGWWWMPGLFLFGIRPVPEDIRHRLPQLDGGPVPCHAAELGDGFAIFKHDGDHGHPCGFPPGSFCGCLGCADCALHVSSRAADLQLVAADLPQDAGEALHGFTFLSSGAGVRMCPPYIPYSPGRVDNSHRGKLFSNRFGNRSGAGRCVFAHLRGDRRFWGHFRACNWDAWICAWIWKTIRNQRYGNGKTPAGFALLGLVVLPLGIN